MFIELIFQIKILFKYFLIWLCQEAKSIFTYISEMIFNDKIRFFILKSKNIDTLSTYQFLIQL